MKLSDVPVGKNPLLNYVVCLKSQGSIRVAGKSRLSALSCDNMQRVEPLWACDSGRFDGFDRLQKIA